jgi:hypothetical protein
MRSRPRSLPSLTPENASRFHSSVLQRQKTSPLEYPEYHPTRKLELGTSVIVPVYADTRWNRTSLYFSKGEKYQFGATGEWQDSKDTCDWKGTEEDLPSVGDVVRSISSFLGNLEGGYKKASGNKSADFLGTKRVEQFNWFTMVGAITNDRGKSESVGHDGSPVSHEYVSLVEYEDTPFEVVAPGYFYAFANDVWSMYENNHGSVNLIVTRVS